MVRVLGNSPERIRIRDLNDVIYYHQQKDYTDQEYEQSRDLQREIKKGTLTKLEVSKSSQSAGGNNGNGRVIIKNQPSPVSLQDIKQAVREVLPEMQSNASVKDAVREAVPALAEIIRQELAARLGAGAGTIAAKKDFRGPEYIPDVSTEDMVANIEIEEREVSGSQVNSNLDALRKLRNNTK